MSVLNVQRMPDEGLPLPERHARQLRPGVAPALALTAIVLQAYLPLYIGLIGLLDLPVLVLVYLALIRRNVVAGLFTGAAMGLAQDGLTFGPVGLFGIINTIIGYLAASVSQFVEVEYPGARSVLAGLFFLVHQTLFWFVRGVLLGNPIVLDVARALVLAAVHTGLALLLYRLFDRLKQPR